MAPHRFTEENVIHALRHLGELGKKMFGRDLMTLTTGDREKRMKINFSSFHSERFSFSQDPVLILENFWNTDERKMFREAMDRSSWTALSDMPPVAHAFQNCGNWLRAEMAPGEGTRFLERVGLPCVADYMESIPNIIGRHINFNYYSYGPGDCLSTHDDTDDAYTYAKGKIPPTRRLALATYFHEEWQTDWGGELILYKEAAGKDGKKNLEVSQCIAPSPGSLVIFTVPRFHRVCRVDSLAGSHKRLSIAGWFMTEH
jgi:SM-20-related protein